MVGFHLYEYARNFFKTCHRLLGLEYEFRMGGYLSVNFHGKNVMIRVSHVGVDQEFIEEIIKSKKYKTILKAFQTQLAQVTKNRKDVQYIASIDSYHPIGGIKNKLLAYQEFLRKYPDYRNRTILI